MTSRFLNSAAALFAAALLVHPAMAQSIPEGQQLISAVRSGDGGKAMGLLSANPTLVNTRDYDGNSALLIALQAGKEDWAGFLIKHGADVDAANKAGDTPLIAATRMGSENVVGWLLDADAKVNQNNKVGETPLILAVQLRNVKLARRLLDAGADPDKSDYSGHSARDYAKRDDRNPKLQEMFSTPKP